MGGSASDWSDVSKPNPACFTAYESARARTRRDVRQTGEADTAEPAGDDELPSYSQQSRWLTATRTPAAFSYNTPVTWRLDGLLDAQAVERA
ncbi:hypothetical protein, partial [Burkholderia pseudomallei]|uniref:hypothetical protein n=1 Tax=Burkholderia pseudomallei TaxID=28450 RepID=UPI000CCE9C53